MWNTGANCFHAFAVCCGPKKRRGAEVSLSYDLMQQPSVLCAVLAVSPYQVPRTMQRNSETNRILKDKGVRRRAIGGTAQSNGHLKMSRLAGVSQAQFELPELVLGSSGTFAQAFTIQCTVEKEI